MKELLELAKEKSIVLVGDYRIEYKGVKENTIVGKTESWVITKRNLPIFEENSKEIMSVEELESYEPKNDNEEMYQEWFWRDDE